MCSEIKVNIGKTYALVVGRVFLAGGVIWRKSYTLMYTFFLRLFVLTMSLVEDVASNRTEIQCIPRMNEAVEVAVVK